MNTLLRFASVGPAAVLGVALAAGCAGYASIDGYDAAYVTSAPVGIEAYPRYRWDDGYVYDVDGRYYHEHRGRWVQFRRPPASVERERRERFEDRGRAERQR